MDVKALQWALAAFVAERGLESRHSPKSLAMALVGEGGTLLDLFKWLSEEESRQIGRQEREAAAEAIAEIFLHALRLADELGIDVEDAVAKKSAKLSGKAPPERRPEAPPAAAPRAAPPPPAPSVERQLKSATRPVPLAGPPSVRPASRSAASPPDFPRVRQAAPPPDFPRVRQAAAPAAPPARPPASPPPRAAAPPAPPPRPAPPARPAAPPPPPPEVEPYADLDLDAVSEVVKLIAKRIDAAQSEDPIVRELHDEIGTLRRTLYGKTLKRSWVGASLKNVRTMLGAALNEDIGEVIKAREHIAEIDRILGD
jgi:NTP pyrophosphatase (non-canonical NTP hydrolase)